MDTVATNKTVRAAAAQLCPVLNRAGGTLEKVLETISRAADEGVEVIAFPETFLPYYPYFSFIEPAVSIGSKHLALYQQALVVPGPETAALSEAARHHSMVVVAGVNERDHGTLYNTQLVFDADGSLVLKRRKITPTYHERMIWGQGDGSGLKVVPTRVGRLGALACWEHFNPLARFALMTEHEQIHVAQFPGSMVGSVFADQMEVAIRQHALEAASFVINATGWLDEEQKSFIDPSGNYHKALSGGSCSAIVSPEGVHLASPLREGEGMVVADMNLELCTKRKRMMDSVGHYARPELLSLLIDREPKGLSTDSHHPTDRSKSDDTRSDTHEPANADQRAAILRSASG